MMKNAGFSLTEVMLATSISGLVVAGTLAVFFVSNRSWFSGDVEMRCNHEADMILQRMVYGAYGTNGLRSAIFTNVSVTASGSQWAVTYRTPDGVNSRYAYSPSSETITYRSLDISNASDRVIGENVRASTVAMVTNGLSIMVRVGLEDGRFAATNTLTTYVRYRN